MTETQLGRLAGLGWLWAMDRIGGRVHSHFSLSLSVLSNLQAALSDIFREAPSDKILCMCLSN